MTEAFRMTDHPPDPGGGTDLEVPPKYTEGATGGPSFPGGGLSVQDKEDIADAANTIEYTGGATGVAAGIVGMSGGGAPAAGGLAVFAGAQLWIASLLSDIADDPPRAYRRIVAFDRRIC